jgi:hypothetical protein
MAGFAGGDGGIEGGSMPMNRKRNIRQVYDRYEDERDKERKGTELSEKK